MLLWQACCYCCAVCWWPRDFRLSHFFSGGVGEERVKSWHPLRILGNGPCSARVMLRLRSTSLMDDESKCASAFRGGILHSSCTGACNSCIVTRLDSNSVVECPSPVADMLHSLPCHVQLLPWPASYQHSSRDPAVKLVRGLLMLAIVIFNIVVVVETPFITQFTNYDYNAATWHTPLTF